MTVTPPESPPKPPWCFQITDFAHPRWDLQDQFPLVRSALGRKLGKEMSASLWAQLFCMWSCHTTEHAFMEP